MQRAHNDIVSSLHFWRITMKNRKSLWLSCLYALSADHFVARLGFLRDHAIDFAVVVNINHAYLDIRHKCVQGGDEMRAPLFGNPVTMSTAPFFLAMTAARIAGLSLKYTLICAFSFLRIRTDLQALRDRG